MNLALRLICRRFAEKFAHIIQALHTNKQRLFDKGQIDQI